MNYNKREQQTLEAQIENFVQLGKKKCGKDRYDYSIARKEYTNNRIPVHLICNNGCFPCVHHIFYIFSNKNVKKQ